MGQETGLKCSECGESFNDPDALNGNDCSNCGNQLLHYVGPSRGSAAELLAEERAEAESEEGEDLYRTLLHLLGCNQVSKKDISSFIHFGEVTDDLNRAIWRARENAEPLDGNEIMVCPSCDAKIKSWARWFDEDNPVEISPNRSI